ncbi:MAG: prepilin-type N-terminal cleavage/methylation domain-containing protein [Luteolibacter sp.]|jgi:general secretion pathway protein G|nr:prepilin-type N-terminal cleavage/methylation domain-containing protein [Luteolibacter sp.]
MLISRKPGFTLVELLIVIVVVATLATLVAMGARSALLASQEAKCISNLRNIGIALHLHAADHGGSFPETSHTAILDKAWITTLEDYLGDYDEIRVCPGDPRRDERLAAGGTSYLLNNFIFVPEVDPWGELLGPALNRPAAIPEPARTILVFTCADRVGTGPGNDHTHSSLWTNWRGVCADIAPGRFGSGGDPHAAQGRANYLYADNRVESIPAAEIKRKTDSGINIAQVPGIP